ncbi:MAG: hypothetical protein V3G42_16635 [Oscillospiraceae bacterium]
MTIDIKMKGKLLTKCIANVNCITMEMGFYAQKFRPMLKVETFDKQFSTYPMSEIETFQIMEDFK